MIEREFDVALVSCSGNGKPNQRVLMHFPSSIARALMERGYNRATLIITDDGFLVRPYQGSYRHHEVANLPWRDEAA